MKKEIAYKMLEIRQEKLYPGIWKFCIGQEEKIRPNQLLGEDVREEQLADKKETDMPAAVAGAKVATSIINARQGNVNIQAGGGGVYGKVSCD